MTPQYWGKSDKEHPGEWHSIQHHSLDVAALVVEYLISRPDLLARLSRLYRLPETDMLAWAGYFAALHDIGKYADGFQAVLPDLMAQLQGACRPAPYKTHEGQDHGTFGSLAWGYKIYPRLVQQGKIPGPDNAGHAAMYAAREHYAPLAVPAFGHHGRPVSESISPQIWREQFARSGGDLLRYVDEVWGLFFLKTTPVVPPLPSTDADRSDLADGSRVLAGLYTLMDWTASSLPWWTYDRTQRTHDYWAHARARSAQYIVDSQMLPVAVSHEASTVQRLCGHTQPTSVQVLAESMPLDASGPHCVIMEAMTGSGKTEAALVLAHRMLRLGHATHIYMAMPTMATADAMYDRLRPHSTALYAESTPVALSHSCTHLTTPLTVCRNPDTVYAGVQDTSWYAQGYASTRRKKALAAPLGVGTVDQVLLSMLPTKHQAVRILGLHDAVIIIDEVHAYDIYMIGVLEQVLRAQRRMGGSVIMLSATLPAMHRERLLRAAGATGDIPQDTRYPLISYAPAHGPLQTHSCAPWQRRHIHVRTTDSLREVQQSIQDALHNGQCVGWVRNSVRDAVDTYLDWHDKLGAEAVTLIHSQFTRWERAYLMGHLERIFGASSTAKDRRGQCVILTQVGEQAMDIDADYIVSDLTVMDLMLQRLGRECRHVRDAQGNPLPAGEVDRRGPPRMLVLTPPWTETPGDRWYLDASRAAAKVYPDHGRIWLTHQWLREHAVLQLPDDLRSALEHVYGADAYARIPAGLQDRTRRAEDTQQQQYATALDYALRMDDGYRCSASDYWTSDVYTPSRLGSPTVRVRLARRTSDGIVPFEAVEGEIWIAWELSEVSTYRSRLDEEYDSQDLRRIKKSMPDAGKYVLTVIMDHVRDEIWHGYARRNGRPVLVRYQRRVGMQIMRI